MMADLSAMMRDIWEQCVSSQYLYRGMSAKDLTDPLDPRGNPLEDSVPVIEECLTMLQRVVDAGFEFTLVERHWDKSYKHDLSNIVAWSLNDLRNPRIDFTPSYQAAREYSDNWQGSQLKQNLKYIAEHMPIHRRDPILAGALTEQDWDLLQSVGSWASRQSPDHRGIVLWVRRSSAVFKSSSRCPLVGPFERFQTWVFEKLESKGAPRTRDSLNELLPHEAEEVYAELAVPLYGTDIEKIEEINPTSRSTRRGKPRV
jgi:hypothetical protein